MAVSGFLMNIKDKLDCQFELFGYDNDMLKSFEVVGKSTGITNQCLDEIPKHKSVIYIKSVVSDINTVRSLAYIATDLLKAGGIGIKIETTGKAFDKQKWLELNDVIDENALYNMFVADNIVRRDGTVFSCGMHNLSLADTIITGEDFQTAHETIRIFNFYQLIDKPVIKDGQTFQTAIDAPKYIINRETNQPYKGDEFFENVFGMWRLTKIN